MRRLNPLNPLITCEDDSVKRKNNGHYESRRVQYTIGSTTLRMCTPDGTKGAWRDLRGELQNMNHGCPDHTIPVEA